MSAINPSLKMPQCRVIGLATSCMRKEIHRLSYEIDSGVLGWRRQRDAEREVNALQVAVRMLESWAEDEQEAM